MSDLNVAEARELIERSSFARRRPTPEFIASRLVARHKRLCQGRALAELTPQELWEEWLPIAGAASFFNLTLDTAAPTGVTASINTGASVTTSQSVTLRAHTDDASATGYQVKVWGNVDTGADANIQASEGASAWFTPTWSTNNADISVTLSSGDGTKTLNLKIRDDVWNESSAASDSITLDTSAPVVTITTGPDATRISKVSGKRVSAFEWSADVAFDEYKIKVVPATSSIHSAGTTIAETNGSDNMADTGSFPASTPITSSIDGRDLDVASAGDGVKIVKIFVKETASQMWSTA
jgi:hypothetical protein